MSDKSCELRRPARPEPSPERPGRGRLTAGRMAAIAAVLGAVIFVCVNIMSSQILRSSRVDLTQQHLYSLSNGTRTLLGELNEPLRFRLFMSSGLTKQAPQLAAFAARVRACSMPMSPRPTATSCSRSSIRGRSPRTRIAPSPTASSRSRAPAASSCSSASPRPTRPPAAPPSTCSRRTARRSWNTTSPAWSPSSATAASRSSR